MARSNSGESNGDSNCDRWQAQTNSTVSPITRLCQAQSLGWECPGRTSNAAARGLAEHATITSPSARRQDPPDLQEALSVAGGSSPGAPSNGPLATSVACPWSRSSASYSTSCVGNRWYTTNGLLHRTCSGNCATNGSCAHRRATLGTTVPPTSARRLPIYRSPNVLATCTGLCACRTIARNFEKEHKKRKPDDLTNLMFHTFYETS